MTTENMLEFNLANSIIFELQFSDVLRGLYQDNKEIGLLRYIANLTRKMLESDTLNVKEKAVLFGMVISHTYSKIIIRKTGTECDSYGYITKYNQFIPVITFNYKEEKIYFS